MKSSKLLDGVGGEERCDHAFDGLLVRRGNAIVLGLDGDQTRGAGGDAMSLLGFCTMLGGLDLLLASMKRKYVIESK